MRALIFICSVVGFSSSPLAGPIEEVIVFADRAEVTRAGVATCRGGKGEVRFEGLPAALDIRTLRAEAEKGATALGTSTRTVTLEAAPDARVAALRAELEQVADALRGLASRRAVTQERGATVEAYAQYFRDLVGEGVRNARPDLKTWTTAMGLFLSEGQRKAEALAALTVEERGLRRKEAVLRERIQRFGAGGQRAVKVVDVSVDCGARNAPKVRLSYVVPGATWRPEYDLRFRVKGKGKTGPGKATLTVSAVIQQSSGEDWENARIVLSTAKPRLGSRAPEPAAIYVRGSDAGEKKTLVQASERREKLRGPAGAVAQGPKSADLDDGGQSFTLKLPRKVTVRSDGRPYWVPVDRRKLKATSKLVTVPKLSPYVFQMAEFHNPAPYPLLAGRLHVHRAGTYVGDVNLPYRAAGEPIEISLGIDEEIQVKRTRLKKTNRSSAFLSSTKHIEHGYRVALENRARGKVEVEIREHIPVSKIDDVKVEILKKTSKGYQLDAHRGFLTWTVPLKRGEKAQRDLLFTIHLPEDWSVR
jgi:uncharacterized protein (TIGR02231 family)